MMVQQAYSKTIAKVPTMSLARQESDQLVLSLLERQEQLEHAQYRFFRYQAAINAYNFAKSRRLSLAQKRLEGQIVAGKAALAALEHNVEKEAQKVKELQEDVSAAEVELDKVKAELSNLDRVVREQNEQISRQGQEIEKLSMSKNQREALVEAFLLLVSLTAVRSSLVTLPVSTALMAFPRRSRVTIATRTSIRFVLFYLLLNRLRQYAILTGWTSEEASLGVYMVNMLKGWDQSAWRDWMSIFSPLKPA